MVSIHTYIGYLQIRGVNALHSAAPRYLQLIARRMWLCTLTQAVSIDFLETGAASCRSATSRRNGSSYSHTDLADGHHGHHPGRDGCVQIVSALANKSRLPPRAVVASNARHAEDVCYFCTQWVPPCAPPADTTMPQMTPDADAQVA